MLKKTGIVLLVLVVVFVVAGLVLPTEYAVSRSIVIHAAPGKIHALVGDLERWEEWTPWREEDPTIEVTYGDKTTGVGASQTWTGDDGSGELVFTSSNPNQGIRFDMTFEEELESSGAILYEADGGATTVTWSMEGDMNDAPVIGGYFAKLMDTMMGPMFDRGLRKLKEQAEK